MCYRRPSIFTSQDVLSLAINFADWRVGKIIDSIFNGSSDMYQEEYIHITDTESATRQLPSNVRSDVKPINASEHTLKSEKIIL